MLKIGHRGWRGNFPENTIYGIEKLFDLGISCVEIDVVTNKNNQLVLSHEPWMNNKFCLNCDGEEIKKTHEKNHNIYKMNQSMIDEYDCGSKSHPEFVFQENKKCSKPLLKDLLDKFDWVNKRIFIEIKCDPAWDNKYHPDIKSYSKIIETELKDFPFYKNVYLMSFDFRILNELQHTQPLWKYVLLAEVDPRKILNKLNFTPEAVGLDHKIINKQLCREINYLGVSIYAWTVNNWQDIKRISDLDIDGMISDYPNRL